MNTCLYLPPLVTLLECKNGVFLWARFSASELQQWREENASGFFLLYLFNVPIVPVFQQTGIHGIAAGGSHAAVPGETSQGYKETAVIWQHPGDDLKFDQYSLNKNAVKTNCRSPEYGHSDLLGFDKLFLMPPWNSKNGGLANIGRRQSMANSSNSA